MGGDVLTPLLDLPGVAAAATGARDAVDALLWDRAVRSRQADVGAESALRGPWANAWFEGAQCGLAELRSGSAVDGSPIGRLLAGSLALAADVPSLVGVIGTSPAQALARMHAVAARGFSPEPDLGRPRQGPFAEDALRVGQPPGPGDVAQRLAGVGSLLRQSRAPGVLVAAVVHAEVAAVRPFSWGSGMVARALLRLVLAQRGVDPGMLGAPEVGLRALGRPQYVRGLRGYIAGTPDGVAEFLVMVCGAVRSGAQDARTWEAVTR